MRCVTKRTGEDNVVIERDQLGLGANQNESGIFWMNKGRR